MKASSLSAWSAIFSLTSGFALPSDISALVMRSALPEANAQPGYLSTLIRRAGGGGGKGGGGGSSSSGSSSSSSGSSGSSGSSSGSSGSSAGASSGSRGAGSYSSTGSTAPAYGRSGNRYAGGGSTPFQAGASSPRGVPGRALPIAGFGLIGLSAGAYAFAYPHGAYEYDLDDVTYTNASANNQVVRAEVQCLCRRYSPCSCDRADDDDDYVQSLIGDGRWISFDQSRWVATPKNGTSSKLGGTNATLVIEGSLNNGTGGLDSAAGFGMHTAAERATWGAVAAAVGVAVMVA